MVRRTGEILTAEVVVLVVDDVDNVFVFVFFFILFFFFFTGSVLQDIFFILGIGSVPIFLSFIVTVVPVPMDRFGVTKEEVSFFFFFLFLGDIVLSFAMMESVCVAVSYVFILAVSQPFAFFCSISESFCFNHGSTYFIGTLHVVVDPSISSSLGSDSMVSNSMKSSGRFN